MTGQVLSRGNEDEGTLNERVRKSRYNLLAVDDEVERERAREATGLDGEDDAA